MISKIKETLNNKQNRKKFLKEKGDGYGVDFLHSDGIIEIGYALYYNNSRVRFCVGLSHIYYGK